MIKEFHALYAHSTERCENKIKNNKDGDIHGGGAKNGEGNMNVKSPIASQTSTHNATLNVGEPGDNVLTGVNF